MEGVWLNTEPNDDSFDDCYSIKLEQSIAEPLTIIEQDDSRTVCFKPDDIDVDPIQKSKAKKVVKKQRQKIPERKQREERTTAKYDTERVAEKSDNEKPKRGKKDASSSEKKSIICDECGKKFTRASGLKYHKLLHAGIKPYVCPEENCGAAFSHGSTLKSHQMTHTGERKFFCEECGQGFLSNFYMQIHQRSKHTGERPFVCGQCGQGFTSKQGLVRHQLEHTGEKPYECQDCGLRFFEKKLLRSHKKTHTTKGKPYVCKECGKGFYHNTSLTAHQRNHSNVRPFGCEICGKRFTQKGTLNIHKVIHSDVRPFGCKECGMQFTQKFTLKTHRMKQHGLTTTKEQKPVHTVMPIPAAEPSQNDKVFPVGFDNIRRSELPESIAPVSMDLTQKSIFPSSKNEPEVRSFAKESSFEADRPEEETSEMKRTSPSLKSESSASESEFKLEADDNDDSTGFNDKFDVDCSTDVLQPQVIVETPTNLDRIKEEPQPSEPLFLSDIWESGRTTPDDEQLNEKPSKKQEAAIKNSLSEPPKPFACGKCERTFALVGALKNHQRTHKRGNGKQDIVCDECGKVLTGKAHLKIHKRTHSGATPYSCKDCGKRFTQLSNMKSHQLTHSGLRPFTCETCGLSFSKKYTLDKHKRTHTEAKTFECDVCGRKSKHPESMKRHKLIHTGERNFGCDICGKTFSEKSYIKFHLRTHTGYKPFSCDQCPSTFIDNSQLTQHKGYAHRRAGEPSPYRRRKLQKMMQMVNNLM